MTPTRCPPGLLLFVLLLLTLAVGCGGVSNIKPRDSRLGLVAILYARFPITNQGRFPDSDQEFRNYINQDAAADLQAAGVADADELLQSERDGQPFVMFYGKDVTEHDFLWIIGHEQTGVEGNRLVAYRSGDVDEIDEARFREFAKER